MQLYVEMKRTGEVISVRPRDWRTALAGAKWLCDDKLDLKASTFVNSLKDGYEDSYIKAYLADHWRY